MSPFLRRAAVSALAAATVTLAAVAPAHADATSECTRFASPTGSNSADGSAARPFKTVQKLIDAIGPGETGCLDAGSYTDNGAAEIARFNHGGAPGRPLTLRPTPGQAARLRGNVYLPKGSDHVTIRNLTIDGRPTSGALGTSISINAADTVLSRNIITNAATGTCVILGDSNGVWGRAARTIISKNLFRDCGSTAHGMLDHSIYVEGVEDAVIVDNTMVRTSGYAVHLYPDARRTLVSHNVMVDNGAGVIFAGEGAQASSDNLVEHNIITGSKKDAGISSWWGGARGTGNVARDNCLSNRSDVELINRGFTAGPNVSVASAGFVSAAMGDYRLQPGSPCAGAFVKSAGLKVAILP